MKETFPKRLKRAMEIRGLKQVDIVERTKMPKSAISQYLSGKFEPKQKAVFLIAEALGVNEAWLLGYEVPMNKESYYPENIFKVETKKLPVLGTIAAGEPILAAENVETYAMAGSNSTADFCLRVQGDSMINARIHDGDLVFVKQQADVNDGEIAAVLIDNEATLKRVYKEPGRITLVAENPAYKPIVINGEDNIEVRILGKAVAFQSQI